MFNVYKNQQSRQTGSRNLMGPKTYGIRYPGTGLGQASNVVGLNWIIILLIIRSPTTILMNKIY
jgi:hypothetical protein